MSDGGRRIKVLHIITRMSKGGAQENTLLNVSRVDDARFESWLLSGPSAGPEGDILGKVRAGGVTFHEMRQLVREPAPLRDTIAYLKLLRFLRRHKFDIVHTHSSKAGILGRWAAYWSGVPVIVHSSHSHVFYGYFHPLVTAFYKVMERAAAKVSDSLQELTSIGVKEHLHHKVGRAEQFQVVYSGQDLGGFLAPGDPAERAALRAELGLSDEHLAVACVARLAPIKGHNTLLPAFAKALESNPNLRLVLVGTGELESQLKDLAKSLDIEEQVIFTGMREDVAALLKASDLFVLASLNEGLGRALVEAGACGLASVATRVGGVPEVVLDGETGLLAPPGDAAAMAEALTRLAADPELRARMGRAAREHVHPKFSIESMIETIEQDYLKHLQRKHPEFRDGQNGSNPPSH